MLHHSRKLFFPRNCVFAPTEDNVSGFTLQAEWNDREKTPSCYALNLFCHQAAFSSRLQSIWMRLKANEFSNTDASDSNFEVKKMSWISSLTQTYAAQPLPRLPIQRVSSAVMTAAFFIWRIENFSWKFPWLYFILPQTLWIHRTQVTLVIIASQP